MDPATALPKLLMAAWLLPLASFAVISIGYSVPQLLGMRVPYSAMKNAAYIAVGGDRDRLRAEHASRCSASGCPHIRSPRPSIMPRAAEHAAGERGASAAAAAKQSTTTARRRTTPAIGTRWASSASSSSRSATTSIRSPS